MIRAVQERFDAFESDRISFLDDVAAMSDEQRSFRPHPDHWNLLDLVQHLMLVEKAFLQQINENPPKPRKSRFHPVVGSMILWIIFNFGIRVKVPSKSVLPSGTMSLDESRSLWDEKQAVLKNYCETLDAASARKKVFFHPIRGSISSITLIDFLSIHFHHHIRQVKRVQRSPHFPKA